MLLPLLLTLLPTLLLGVEGSRSLLSCPSVCSCSLDRKGRREVTCEGGGMEDPLPVLEMPEDAEVLVVSAPETNPNSLTLGPIFKGHLNLEQITVTHSGVPALGAHSFWGLRRLRMLNMSHNSLSGLMGSNFRGPDSLKELNLSNNRIESIPSAIFRYVRQLQFLDLSSNKIPELVPRIFFGLSKLEVLFLSNNPLGDLPFDRFLDIPHIRDLRCSKCGLLSVTSTALQVLTELVYLDLRNNRLTQVPPVTFTRKLEILLLDGNHIAVLGRGTVSWLPLKKLTLSHNQISSVETGSFDNTSLTSLDLSYNKIASLQSRALDNVITQVREFDISGNLISIDQLLSLLPKARQLRRLNLGDLGLTRLPPELLRHSRHLRYLNVSANYLSKFPHELLYSTPHLQYLDLSTNSFHGLHKSLITAFKSMSSLNNIKLEGNPWLCEECHVISIMEWLKNSTKQPNSKAACSGIRPTQQCLRCAGPVSLAGEEILFLKEEQLPTCVGADNTAWPAWMSKAGYPSRLGDDPRTPIRHFDYNYSETKVEKQESLGAFFKDHLALLVGVGCGLILALLLVVVVAVALSRRHSAFYYTCESDEERKEKLMAINNNDSPITRSASSPNPTKSSSSSTMAISRVHAQSPIRSTSRTPTVTFSPQGTATIATIDEITALDNEDSQL